MKTNKVAAARAYEHKPQLIFRDFNDINGNYEKELGAIRHKPHFSYFIICYCYPGFMI